MLRVGIGSRNYGYARVAYGLPVDAVRYSKPVYIPWKFIAKSFWLENTYAFVPCHGVELFHLWNGILLNRAPFVTSFESHLPRIFDSQQGILHRMAMQRLRSRDCRRVLALSEFARRAFLQQHEGDLDDHLVGKLEVFYGGVPVATGALEKRLEGLARSRSGPFRCCFVGHDFFRKGGYAVVRAFERLVQRGYDVRLVVVSRLVAGDYASHEPLERAAEVRAILQAAPWAEWHETLAHARVLELMATCHLGLLPTLADTFGWSAVEAMSHGLPMIVTNVCAMPEIVTHDVNGYCIELEIDPVGRWTGHAFRGGTRDAREALQRAYERIEEGVVVAVSRFIESPDDLEAMSRHAISHVREHHDPGMLGTRLAGIYRDAMRS